MAAQDKHWAQAYVNDPLNAPEPFQEDGPGTHFGNSLASDPKQTSSYPTPPDSAGRDRITSFGSNNPFLSSLDVKKPSTRARASSDVSGRLQKTLPSYSSHHRSSQYRKEAFGSYAPERPRSAGHSRNVSNASNSSTLSRGNSLNQRPLEFARDEAKIAHRSPHLKKRHLPGPDQIDRLDVVSYHHEGPYDATLLARNRSWETSPLAAVADSNAEALKATPRENIIDSIERHRPLVGTATIAPGETDRFGRRYDYKEGDNMMIVDGGNYKRWPGVVRLTPFSTALCLRYTHLICTAA
ncbi:hypothetical protein, variant [Verruconis gallopava]|uniref:Uncharacterized protein n=1 Tax=Verruconis gallopava TaxID=253628 RepID=A0A0D1XFM8_9PEZI|nr:hypothetical protein, variant [Verruconis gallopava]KIW00991.1 hypothetical protein, variant [Verruconis gallopava]